MSIPFVVDYLWSREGQLLWFTRWWDVPHPLAGQLWNNSQRVQLVLPNLMLLAVCVTSRDNPRALKPECSGPVRISFAQNSTLNNQPSQAKALASSSYSLDRSYWIPRDRKALSDGRSIFLNYTSYGKCHFHYNPRTLTFNFNTECLFWDLSGKKWLNTVSRDLSTKCQNFSLIFLRVASILQKLNSAFSVPQSCLWGVCEWEVEGTG